MNDLISRQAAIDWLSNEWDGMVWTLFDGIRNLPSAQQEQAVKDCRNCKHGKYNDHFDTYFCYCAEECDSWDKWEPSAQPEIIRCMDCKHYYYADNRIPEERRYTCDLDGDRWRPDSFCSFAERRTDEDD